jgi:hypothetical protein
VPRLRSPAQAFLPALRDARGLAPARGMILCSWCICMVTSPVWTILGATAPQCACGGASQRADQPQHQPARAHFGARAVGAFFVSRSNPGVRPRKDFASLPGAGRVAAGCRLASSTLDLSDRGGSLDGRPAGPAAPARSISGAREVSASAGAIAELEPCPSRHTGCSGGAVGQGIRGSE